MAAIGQPVFADDIRDLVFECPCSAVWTSGGDTEGRLVLRYGLRSFRSMESAEVVLAPYEFGRRPFPPQHPDEADIPHKFPVTDPVQPHNIAVSRQSTISFPRPEPGNVIGIALWERVGQAPAGLPRTIASQQNGLQLHEVLSLWPVPRSDPSRVRFVDILSDADGDGVGDANERAAGSDPDDPASTPGPTTIDVLAVYNDGIREYYGGHPQTRIHHLMAVANSVFVDTGTNIRLRTVGMSEIQHDESGVGPSAEDRAVLMDRHGADLYLQWHARSRHPKPDANCDAFFGRCGVLSDHFGYRLRGHWSGDYGIRIVNPGVVTLLHEIGHVMGLGHSARQGEAWGAFRWSRGHYIESSAGRSPMGTIMAYGRTIPVFSNPNVDCFTGPCGIPIDQTHGADAVASLNLLRFQIASNRAALSDADDDGFVDPVDAFPDNPSEWSDADGDGFGDVADSDDDNDGVDDSEDAFPLDPDERADIDDDGVGDSVDDDIVDLTPFRDAALRAAVEEALDKAPGEPISSADMERLIGLDLPPRGIRDLTGLELAINLESLTLFRNHVRDLSPLSNLTQLRTVTVFSNDIVDLSPLSGVAALEYLYLSLTRITDLTPLKELEHLQVLSLHRNVALVDISPVSKLPRLRSLNLTESWNVDFSDLAEFNTLSTLHLANVRLSDLSPLRNLSRLERLVLTNNNISHLTSLDGMTGLRELVLDQNPLSDLSPLAALPELRELDISMTPVDDLTPLAALHLERLNIGWTPLTLHSLLALPNASELSRIGVSGLRIRDISPLGAFDALQELDLNDNAVSSIAPLSNTPVSRLLLANNAITDLAPLARAERWQRQCGSYCFLDLRGNPLNQAAHEDHVPRLEAWGANIRYTENQLQITDSNLREIIAQQFATGTQYVDDPLTEDDFSPSFSMRINGFNAGVSDLAGLEGVAGLNYVFLGSNAIENVAPLSGHDRLIALDLSHNVVSDLGPLVANSSTKHGRWIALTGNPLTVESLNAHIPTLREAGWTVRVDSIVWIVLADGASEFFDTTAYFRSLLGAGLQYDAIADGSDLASITMEGGALVVSPEGTPGQLTVTVTATTRTGETASLDFRIALARPNLVPLFPAAADAVRQGFVRVINRSKHAGAVRIDAIDDAGQLGAPMILALRPGAAAQFNSADLENGNRNKRLTGYAGTGEGDWRLRLASGLDIDVLAYIRTHDGFLTSMHDVVPKTDEIHQVATFNPGSNQSQLSLLRLVNPGDETVDVTIVGVDDEGESPGRAVMLSLAPGKARTVSAHALESGEGLAGALGDGTGKWRLAVTANKPIVVKSLLESPSGHLTNLSTIPTYLKTQAEGKVTHHVPLFLSAADPKSRQGFVRVVNRGSSDATVQITANDETDADFEKVMLSVDAGSAVQFNSEDLELGNPKKGLSHGVGAGTGNWRLQLKSDTDLDVLAYIRTEDGFLTSMHDVVPLGQDGYIVPIFNPSSNRNQASRLHVVNSRNENVSIAIEGHDDLGRTGEETVRLIVPARRSRTVSAQALEDGDDELDGGLGNGEGKWRLTVTSDQPIQVISLLESPTGHITNLSTVPTEVSN